MASLIGAQFATKRKSALETESSQNENQPSVVSSADGAKTLKILILLYYILYRKARI